MKNEKAIDVIKRMNKGNPTAEQLEALELAYAALSQSGEMCVARGRGGSGKMKETINARAVKIAAKVMQAAGLCRYDTPTKCRRVSVDEATCDKCIRAWLINKARRELEREGMHG